MKKIREKDPIVFRREPSQKIVFAFFFVIFLLYTLAILYVYAFALNGALKENGRAYMRDPISLAKPAYWRNFAKSFKVLEANGSSYFDMIWNSIWQSVGATLISLIVRSMSSYVLAKYKFHGRDLIYGTMLVTMMLPIMGTGPARYKLYSDLGIIDTPFMLITSISGLCDLYIYAAFKGVSWEYAEAAYIDGANDGQVFLKIMLPQALPFISIMFATGIIGAWQDYSTALLYYKSYTPLATGIYIYEKKIQYMANQPVFFAGILLATIPPLIAFFCLQNTIMTKVYIGGLKG